MTTSNQSPTPDEEDHSFERHTGYEDALGSLFHDAAQGHLSINDLYEHAKRLESLCDDTPAYEARYADLLLKDAFGFIDELHDDSTRHHTQRHPELLQSYADQLLGKATARYERYPTPNVRLTITYQQRKQQPQ